MPAAASCVVLLSGPAEVTAGMHGNGIGRAALRASRATSLDALHADLVGPFTATGEETLPLSPSAWTLSGFIMPESDRASVAEDLAALGDGALASDALLPLVDAYGAKLVVVDEERVFVTSANFTRRAQERNIEAGIALDDHKFGRRLTGPFREAVSAGDFVEVGVGRRG